MNRRARMLVMVATLVAVGACRRSLRDERVTEQNASEVSRRISEGHELTPQEAMLFALYMARHEMGERTGPDAAPLSLTVVEVLARQRAFMARIEVEEQQRAAEDRRRQAAAVRVAQQAAAQVQARQQAEARAFAALRVVLDGQLMSLEIHTRYPGADHLLDQLVVRARFTNHGTQSITSAEGGFVLRAADGSEAGLLPVIIDRTIAPGASLDLERAVACSDLLEHGRTPCEADVPHLRGEWDPMRMVYADGSRAGFAPPDAVPAH